MSKQREPYSVELDLLLASAREEHVQFHPEHGSWLIANRAAVLRALGLREERGLDIHGPNPQRRFVTEWEDVPDE